MDETAQLLLEARVAKLQGEICALQSAIVSGETRVSYEGKSVDYDDLNGLKQRLNFATNLLNELLNNNQRKPQCGRVLFSTGYRKRPLGGGGNWGF